MWVQWHGDEWAQVSPTRVSVALDESRAHGVGLRRDSVPLYHCYIKRLFHIRKKYLDLLCTLIPSPLIWSLSLFLACFPSSPDLRGDPVLPLLDSLFIGFLFPSLLLFMMGMSDYRLYRSTWQSSFLHKATDSDDANQYKYENRNDFHQPISLFLSICLSALSVCGSVMIDPVGW